MVRGINSKIITVCDKAIAKINNLPDSLVIGWVKGARIVYEYEVLRMRRNPTSIFCFYIRYIFE